MRHLKVLFAALLLLPGLAACSSNNHSGRDPLTPAYEPPEEPSDEQLAAAVSDFLQSSDAPVASQYEFARFDLDNDGLRDAMVLFKTPYGYWCDRNGCTMLVLKAGDNEFKLVNAVQPVRGPLFVSQTESHGWKDLMIRVSGRWEEAKNVAIRYNGHSYSPNPAALPATTDTASEYYSMRAFMGG